GARSTAAYAVQPAPYQPGVHVLPRPAGRGGVCSRRGEPGGTTAQRGGSSLGPAGVPHHRQDPAPVLSGLPEPAVRGAHARHHLAAEAHHPMSRWLLLLCLSLFWTLSAAAQPVIDQLVVHKQER